MGVRERLTHARLGAWQAALAERLSTGLTDRLDATAAAPWLMRPEVLELLDAFERLTPAFRRLGAWLIARRTGPPPWGRAIERHKTYAKRTKAEPSLS